METEKKNKMRMIVRDVMSQKVESLIENDIFMDNEVRDRIFDSLPSDLEIDDEIEECLLNGEMVGFLIKFVKCLLTLSPTHL